LNCNHLLYQIALTLLHGVGPVKAKELLLRTESIEDIFVLSSARLAKISELNRTQIDKMNRQNALKMASMVLDHMKKHKIQPLFSNQAEFPRRLKNCIDAPLLLYGKGELPINRPKLVAIVGTRNATSYGKRLCDEIIASFVDQNIVVVSGLAAGIDTHVHQRCVDLKVPTIGVLGHGFDRIYPATNRQLAKNMLEKGGLLTEFIPGTTPDRENFPKRNRIVAGMTDATIVVESKLKGGSLITAGLANDYNRDVFAYPGSIHKETSQGCNRLIADQKAHLLQSPDDFLTMMNWKESESKKDVQRQLFPNLTAIQTQITMLLAETQMLQIDMLSLKTSLPISQLNIELFQLEMNGVIQSLPGKKYCLA